MRDRDTEPRAPGNHAEDHRDEVVVDSRLYAGVYRMPEGCREERIDAGGSWQEDGRSFYAVDGVEAAQWFPNQCLYPDGAAGAGMVVRRIEDGRAVIEPARDYRAGCNTVWGVTARNIEQNFALNLLMDPDIDIVTLAGTAGTGKTLLALAAGLAQTLDEKRYREIVATRVTVPVGDDIGFLPGTEEEKMIPWMGALMDNLEVLTDPEAGGSWGRAATNDLLRSRIRIRSLNFMRGRTFLNRYVILDEAQNLTRHQMKTLITRAGPGTKMVCLGNVRQIRCSPALRDDIGPDPCRRPVQAVAPQRPRDAGARRALETRGFRYGVPVSGAGLRRERRSLRLAQGPDLPHCDREHREVGSPGARQIAEDLPASGHRDPVPIEPGVHTIGRRGLPGVEPQ